MDDTVKSTTYEFREFCFDTESRQLFERETGKLVQLQPKAFEFLLFLIENEEQILTKNELLDAI